MTTGVRLSKRFGVVGGLIVVAWGSTGAPASPVVPPQANETRTPQATQASQITEAPALLGVERELARALPVPAVVAPTIDAGGSDPRLAGLPSDHRRPLDTVRPRDPNIHIPEPASIVLLATGAVGLLARRALRRGQD